MGLVPEADRGDGELALLFDVGLVGTVDHDIGYVGIVEQLFQRTEAKQFVDQNLFQRELFAPVQRNLEIREHFHDDGPEFFRKLIF